MTLRFHPSCILAVLATLAVGCASRSGGKLGTPSIKFPSDAAMQEIAARAVPKLADIVTPTAPPVERWELRGPALNPTTAPTRSADDPLSVALAKHLAGVQGVRTSTATACFAHQLGAFMLEYGAQPSEELRSFLSARCGVGTVSWSVQTVSNDPDELPSPDELVRAIHPATIPNNADVGYWVGRTDSNNIYVRVVDQPKVEFTDFEVEVGDAPVLRIHGRSNEPYGWIQGTTTIGDVGFGECVPDPTSPVAPPQFAFVCPVDTHDEFALVELMAGRPGRILGELVARRMILIGGNAEVFMGRVGTVDKHGATSLVAGINAIRQDLSMQPLREAEAQSKVVESLIPHLYAARLTDDAGLADQIALGILAGWHISGRISGGYIASFRQQHSVSIDQQIANLLFLPSHRRSLLGRDQTEIAIASWGDNSHSDRLGFLATYELYKPKDFTAEAGRFLDELDRQRRARGLAPVTRVEGETPNAIIDTRLAQVERLEVTPAKGLNSALEAFVKKTGRDFYGLVFQASVLDGWQPNFEPTILNAREVEAAVRVGFFKPKGAAWGEYVVYVVYAAQK